MSILDIWHVYLWKENHAKIERGNILFITEILIYLNK